MNQRQNLPYLYEYGRGPAHGALAGGRPVVVRAVLATPLFGR